MVPFWNSLYHFPLCFSASSFMILSESVEQKDTIPFFCLVLSQNLCKVAWKEGVRQKENILETLLTYDKCPLTQ